MLSKKKWFTRKLDNDKLKKIKKEFPKISPLVLKILVSRGYDDKSKIEDFLDLDIKKLYDPFLLPDMDKAVSRIKQAIEKNERILIYGDYDADGITSTSVLRRFFKFLKVEVQYYLPHRLEEGYGLNEDAIRQIASRGIDLIITVDCGISSLKEVELCRELGVDIVITDHHTPGDKIPKAIAVVDAKRKDEGYPQDLETRYPFEELAGVGIAYKLVCALLKSYIEDDMRLLLERLCGLKWNEEKSIDQTDEQGIFSLENGQELEQKVRSFAKDDLFDKKEELELIDKIDRFLGSLREIVAFGTIADLVPLKDENRVLVYNGLENTKDTDLVFWNALLKGNNNDNKIDAETVAFQLAPSLNALGRLCSDDIEDELNYLTLRAQTFIADKLEEVGRKNVTCLGVELLTTDDMANADLIAEFLRDENENRKDICEKIFREAVKEKELYDKEYLKKECEQGDSLNDTAILNKNFAKGIDLEEIEQAGSEENIQSSMPIIILKNPENKPWHVGVIGIVASKLLEKYYRPVILLCEVNGVLKGSARSIKGFHLFDSLTKVKDILINYGGHELAAGLTLAKDKFEEFRTRMEKIAWEELSDDDLIPKLEVDVADVDLDDLSLGFLEELQLLAPFGQDNKQPVLTSEATDLVAYSTMGKNANHLRLKAKTGDNILEAVWFNEGDICDNLNKEDKYHLAFTLSRNDYFKNNPRLQLMLLDMEKEIKNEEHYGFWVVSLPNEKKIKLSIGTALRLYFDQHDFFKSGVIVTDEEKNKLGNLPEWILPKLFKFLQRSWHAQKQGFVYCWFVGENDGFIQIGLELVNSSLNKEEDLNKEYAHLGLSAWRIARLVYYNKLKILYKLECSLLFFQRYSKYFTEEKEGEKANILKVRDSGNEIDKFLMTRELFVELYLALKSYVSANEVKYIEIDADGIIAWLRSYAKKKQCILELLALNKEDLLNKIEIGLDILEELKLLKRDIDEGKYRLYYLLRKQPSPPLKFEELQRFLEISDNC